MISDVRFRLVAVICFRFANHRCYRHRSLSNSPAERTFRAQSSRSTAPVLLVLLRRQLHQGLQLVADASRQHRLSRGTEVPVPKVDRLRERHFSRCPITPSQGARRIHHGGAHRPHSGSQRCREPLRYADVRRQSPWPSYGTSRPPVVRAPSVWKIRGDSRSLP